MDLSKGIGEILKTKKINPNQMVSLVILVVTCLIALNIYQRQNNRIAQVRQLFQEQSKKNILLLEMGDLRRTFIQYQKRLQPKDPREVINTITIIARTSGVEINALKPLPERGRVKSKIFDKIFFNVKVQVDSYNKLGSFISKLENSSLIFIVESLVLEQASDSKAAQGGNLRAELDISQLFFKD